MLAPWQASPRLRRSRWAVLIGLCLLGAPLACQKTYYTVLESVGIEKRELLATRVEKAKESQEEAQEAFRDALERFQAVTGHDGGDLEDKYESLREAYESSREQAAEVSERIDKIESVADALFDEWENELKQYSDASLRRSSSERLLSTRSQVKALLRVMRKAERSLKPVLDKLHDRVLYLKHNLNAAALSGLRDKLPELQDDVARLVAEMQASIAEADQFIESMK
jgi:DNA repair exonuclease SbcCD ATPase subunit